MIIKKIIKEEIDRQQTTISLIASENYPTLEVREAVGSLLMSKYAEGYPRKRYYAGNRKVDEIEEMAISAAKKLFGAEHANVQPYSGTPANLAIYNALLEPGDRIMGMSLAHGGHLSHGHKANYASKIYKFIQYGVDETTGELDYEEIKKLARIFKPKLIVCGATAYSRKIDFKKFAQIAKEVNAYCLADISHIAGLIAGGLHQNPTKYCDVVMTTTHKTLRGPRGAIILCKESLANQIDKAVFPGIQGGPHINTIAGKAICLLDANKPAFKKHAKQIILNAKVLADELKQQNFKISTNGTDNHLILIDLSSKGLTGKEAETALEIAGITVNKNMIPGDTRSPFDPSGMRLGVAAITSRGMREQEIKEIAKWINEVIANHKSKVILNRVNKSVKKLCKKFPIK